MNSILDDYIQKIDRVNNLLNLLHLGVAGGGIIDLKERLNYAIEEWNEKKNSGTLNSYLSGIAWGTEYDQYKNDRKNILKYVIFDFEKEIESIVEQEDFVNLWNNLDTKKKSSLLFLSSNVYACLRSKLNTQDFNFVFENELEKFDLQWMEKWFEIPAGQKVAFFKLKKESQGKDYAFFYENAKYQEMNNLRSEDRKREIQKYLPEICKQLNEERQKSGNEKNVDWYHSIDLIFSDFITRHVFTYLNKQENKFNNFHEMSQRFHYPNVIKKWLPTLGIIEGQELNSERLLFLEKNQEQGWSKEEMQEFKKEAKENGVEEFFETRYEISKLNFYERLLFVETFFKKDILNLNKEKKNKKVI